MATVNILSFTTGERRVMAVVNDHGEVISGAVPPGLARLIADSLKRNGTGQKLLTALTEEISGSYVRAELAR